MIRLPGRRIDQLPVALRNTLGATTARMYVFVIVTGLLTAIALLLSPPATVGYDVGTLADRAVTLEPAETLDPVVEVAQSELLDASEEDFASSEIVGAIAGAG